MAAFEQLDLDRCIHCGLCLNACPTYRELGLEADSPRGRIYQMAGVASGAAPMGAAYLEHLGLCLACRACETACPSGVPYGRLIEAARVQIETTVRRPWYARALRQLVFGRLFDSPALLRAAGTLLWLYQATGVRRLVELSGLFRGIVPLAPTAERPFFFRAIGHTYPPEGPRRYRVALLAGCIANVCFARLNEATVRVLQRNGCEVDIPAGQTCCGALHLHIGMREKARRLARRNIDAFLAGGYDAVITNAAGCGAALKEYGELLADDPLYAAPAQSFSKLVKDASEFLAAIGIEAPPGRLPLTVTYQDSCHLAHAQRIRAAPRKLLAAIPGLTFREMPQADLCCGSAGVYNVAHQEMAGAILRKKMEAVASTGADVIATANPGCILQLRAGARLYGQGQRVAHVIELLDEAYGQARTTQH